MSGERGEEEGKERGFTIVDRRDDEVEESVASATGDAQEAPSPPIDFTGFALSLGTSALYHMGLVADPESGAPGPVDLPVARQTIDTLVMLQEKTQGNLDDEEQALLTNLLTELRMRYVESSKG